MQKYKVLSPSFTTAEGVQYEEGEVVVLDSSYPIHDLIREGAIEVVPEVITARYEVIKGPVANREGERFLTGNIVELPVEDDLTKVFLADGFIVPENTRVVGGGVDEELKAPVEPGTDGEPRKRYRGIVVLTESERTVGEQVFKHIHCADGVEYDLTDAEYVAEVHLSFPPAN